MNTVIVTRHQTLVEHLIETGIAPADAQVIEHATAENVEGAHVIGVLPIHLAALTARYTNVAVVTPPELRGVELTLEQVREFAQPAVTYEVRILYKENCDVCDGVGVTGGEPNSGSEQYCHWCGGSGVKKS